MVRARARARVCTFTCNAQSCFQIFVWDDSDPCIMFPTLYFDVLVDMFFMVRNTL